MTTNARWWVLRGVGVVLFLACPAFGEDDLELPDPTPARVAGDAAAGAAEDDAEGPVTDAPTPDAADPPADGDEPTPSSEPASEPADDAAKPADDAGTDEPAAADTAAVPVAPEPEAPPVPAADEPADIVADVKPAAPAPAAATAPAATKAAAGTAVPRAPTPPDPPKKPVLVPGTGSLVKGVGDDFEDENWKWFHNHPKSSEEQDKRVRFPLGKSANGRWFEGPKRGTPDVVKRVALPAPGLEGSAHGLLISTLNAGVPGRTSYQMHQDDLIYNMQRVTGQGIHTADSPSVVVRVYMPPLEQWEQRSGPSFGFRAGCYTHAIITGKDHPQKGRFGLEEYWPGMFVCLEKGARQRDGTVTADSAYLRIRSGKRGGEIRGPTIDRFGWWTLGLSFSPDGMVHYFARPGVDELSMDDHITSQYPYGYRTEWLKTFFFNVCNRDDGRTWSTPWVVDDPRVYFVKRPQVASPNPTRKSR